MTTFAGHWGPEPFLDRRGNAQPLADVYVYTVGTTTPITLYANRLKSATIANPLPKGVGDGTAGLDVKGNGDFFAEPGTYRMVVKLAGSTVFDDTVTVELDPLETQTSSGIARTATGLLTPTTVELALQELAVALDDTMAVDAFGRADRANIDGDTAPTGQVWHSSGGIVGKLASNRLVASNPATVGSAYSWLELVDPADVVVAELVFTSGADPNAAGLIVSSRISTSAGPFYPANPGLNIAVRSVHLVVSPTAWGLSLYQDESPLPAGVAAASFATPLTKDGTTRHRIVMARLGDYIGLILPDVDTNGSRFVLYGPNVKVGQNWGQTVLIEHYHPAPTSGRVEFTSLRAYRQATLHLARAEYQAQASSWTMGTTGVYLPMGTSTPAKAGPFMLVFNNSPQNVSNITGAADGDLVLLLFLSGHNTTLQDLSAGGRFMLAGTASFNPTDNSQIMLRYVNDLSQNLWWEVARMVR